jgi:hypothetical protein
MWLALEERNLVAKVCQRIRRNAEDARIKLKRLYPSIEEGALVEQSVD